MEVNCKFRLCIPCYVIIKYEKTLTTYYNWSCNLSCISIIIMIYPTIYSKDLRERGTPTLQQSQVVVISFITGLSLIGKKPHMTSSTPGAFVCQDFIKKLVPVV